MSVERITSWIGSTVSLVVHTIIFVASFGAAIFGFVPWDRMLLVVTTIVSLEAIYLSIFIQMTVNRQAAEIQEVSEDVEDIQESVEDLSENVEDIQDDIEEITESP
jgi:peptidoglycan hydrolase CwlO-like protein